MFFICAVSINQGFFKKNVYDQPQLMSNNTNSLPYVICLQSFTQHQCDCHIFFFLQAGWQEYFICRVYGLLTETPLDLCALWECRSVNKLMFISLSKHVLEAEKW